ncbi:MAG TPA: c-type cytochrome [Polyangiales bacterium]|nr:c-type cytochrome [Polyangiales bacterium]
MRVPVVSSLALLAVLGACGSEPAPKREWTPADHGQPANPDESMIATDRVIPGEDPEARAARALWNATCASCHGRDGRGQGEQRPPGATIADFTSAEWQASRTDQALTLTIDAGRGMMPAFGKQINPQGIGAMVRHVRRFAEGAADPGAAAAPEAHPTRAP